MNGGLAPIPTSITSRRQFSAADGLLLGATTLAWVSLRPARRKRRGCRRGAALRLVGLRFLLLFVAPHLAFGHVILPPCALVQSIILRLSSLSQDCPGIKTLIRQAWPGPPGARPTSTLETNCVPL